MSSANRIALMHVQAMMELPNEMKIMILPRDPGKLLHFEPELSRPKFNDLTKRRNSKRKRNPDRWR